MSSRRSSSVNDKFKKRKEQVREGQKSDSEDVTVSNTFESNLNSQDGESVLDAAMNLEDFVSKNDLSKKLREMDVKILNVLARLEWRYCYSNYDTDECDKIYDIARNEINKHKEYLHSLVGEVVNEVEEN